MKPGSKQACRVLCDGDWSWDWTQDVIEISSSNETVLGYPREELPRAAARWIERLHPRDRPIFRRELADMARGKVHEHLLRVRQADGDFAWVLLRGAVQHDASGQPCCVAGGFVDFSSVRRAENALLLAARIMDETPEGILITTADKRIVEVNPAFERTTGYRRDEVVGHDPSILSSGRHEPGFYAEMWHQLAQKGYWQGEIWNRRKNGEIYPEWLSLMTIANNKGKITNYVGIFSDISTHAAIRERLHNLAYYDPLTGLPNRALFQDRLAVVLEQAERNHHPVALMFIDLDRFKEVNDTLGHSLGDVLLARVAERLNDNCRKSDTVARLGGDEFAVILPRIRDANDAASIAEKLNQALLPPFELNGSEVHIRGSFGISLYPQDGRESESLLKYADMAMYHAKSAGQDSIQFFREELGQHVRRRIGLQTSLRKAIENDELHLAYQPQVCLQSGRILGVEALARWHDLERGDISPADFSPIAEDSGLIAPLGEWVLDRAIREAQAWPQAQGPVRLGINASVSQIRKGHLERLLRQHFLRPGMQGFPLEIEITESLLMDDVDRALTRLEGIHALGVSIAIDDFGTGYSSLSYLKRFPVERLKIDQSFVRDLTQDPNDRAIVSTIIAMGRHLGLQVIAEGVESHGQMDFLRTEGCDEAQGYFLARPMTSDTIIHAIGKGIIPID